MERASLTTGQEVHHNNRDDEEKRSCCGTVLRRIKRFFIDNLLLCTTLIGVFLGFGIGFAARVASPSEDAIMWIGLPGQLYLRLLKMMIVPLIACSVLCGAASLDPKANGKISLISFIFIISTNALGSAMGIGSVYMFNPGKDRINEVAPNMDGDMQTQDIIADLIRNIIPDNLFEATFSQTQTKYRTIESMIQVNDSGILSNETTRSREKYFARTANANIIGLIFACTLLGVASTNLKEKGRPFLELIQSVSDTVIVVVRWFMWTTPIGVISLIAVSIAQITSISNVFSQLALFIAAITVGISFQQLVVMSGIFFAFTRKNPFRFLFSIARPWMIAFAATSTAVAIPEMMAACEERNKIDKRISRFVIPFSVTISCNGSALYISGATVFIANLTGTDLTLADVLLIWLLVMVAAMAIPSVPSASILTTIMILSSMNIPDDDIALLLAIEWYLDRIRSTSSVVSHTFCTAVVYSLCKGDLDKLDEKMHEHQNGVSINMSDYDKPLSITVANGKMHNGNSLATSPTETTVTELSNYSLAKDSNV